MFVQLITTSFYYSVTTSSPGDDASCPEWNQESTPDFILKLQSVTSWRKTADY